MALSAVMLTGCTGTGDESTAAGPPSNSPMPSNTSTPTALGAASDCSVSDNEGIPEGARSASTIDVDGDLEADQQWVTEDGQFGVTTTTGIISSRPTNFFGGAEPTALVADVSGQGNGSVIMLVAGSRTVDLYRWNGCALEPVTNTDGDQYQFDLTGQHGTGVGCTNIDSTPQLVGLLANRPAGAPSDTDQIAVTPIKLDGVHAENGRTLKAEPADDTAATRATQVTCADRTLEDDGLGIMP